MRSVTYKFSGHVTVRLSTDRQTAEVSGAQSLGGTAELEFVAATNVFDILQQTESKSRTKDLYHAVRSDAFDLAEATFCEKLTVIRDRLHDEDELLRFVHNGLEAHRETFVIPEGLTPEHAIRRDVKKSAAIESATGGVVTLLTDAEVAESMSDNLQSFARPMALELLKWALADEI